MLDEFMADVASAPDVRSSVFIECGEFYSCDPRLEMRPIGETEYVAAVGGPGGLCEAIVGFADLTSGNAEAILTRHISAGGGRFVGIRQSAAWDASPDIRRPHNMPDAHLYQREDFRTGFARLEDLRLSFDAWQYHPQLPELLDLAQTFPGVSIVVNHVGGALGIGPYDREAEFEPWRRSIVALARCPNVSVKIGGLGMALFGFGFDARAIKPDAAELAQAWRPYVATCIEAFGVERAMFESNFPVDSVSCSYANLWAAYDLTVAGASEAERAALFSGTARRFYRLP